ncbi:MAG: calcium-binding protein [bacterium]
MPIIWMDDFESATGATSQVGVTRVAAEHTDTANGTFDSVGDYAFRTTIGGIDAGIGSSHAFTGHTSNFWRAEDLDAIAGANFVDGADVINWTGIDITGQSNLQFSGMLAAAVNQAGGFYRFENDDYIIIEYQIDSGGYNNILEVRGDNAGGGLNGDFRIDTNNDTVGDGALVSETFQTFTAAIAGAGSTLDLRLSYSVDGSNEEIGFENFAIEAVVTNSAPVASSIEGTNLSYSERGGAQAITSTLALTDSDDTNLEGATVTISGGLDTTNDSLIFVNQNGISGTYTAGTGVLALTGTSSVANYQSALRSISYQNAFTTESTTTRTIDFVVNDGTDNSATVSRSIDFVIDETISGTAGNDGIGGGFGNDTLNGLAGNDRLSGHAGNDILNGGDDNDRLFGGLGSDTLNGDAGIDTAVYAKATSGVVANLATGGSVGEAAGDTYNSIENLFGSDFADILSGDTLVNTINGLGGNDTLNGSNGNDLLIGSTGTDTLNGDADNDRLFGQADNDTLNGGAGNDRLWGGAGSDNHDGGTGIDSAMYSNAGAAVTVNLATGGTVGDAAGDTYTGVENVIGSNFDDTITGDGFDNFINGLAGADTLNGGAGNDTLTTRSGGTSMFGDAGNDRLFGSADADLLDGGADNDTLIGRGGANTYHFAVGNHGADRIRGFQDGTDIIQYDGVAGVASFADLIVTQMGAHTLISSAAISGTILALNSTATDFTSADFSFI